METFRFKDFNVYIKSKLLYSRILQITKLMKDFSLKDQSRRAALSVVLNIAEGSAKKSDKDFARFLQTSLGSVNELYACLDLMKDNGFIGKDTFVKLEVECNGIARQLGGFSKVLRVKS